MIKASLYCACTIALLVFLGQAVVALSLPEFGYESIFGLMLFGGALWIVSFISCLILLFPLAQVFRLSSPLVSFVVFTVLGFIILSYPAYDASISAINGEIPALYQEDNFEILISILLQGMAGFFGAASAWYCLKQGVLAKDYQND